MDLKINCIVKAYDRIGSAQMSTFAGNTYNFKRIGTTLT